jgi:hypothetical protein
LILARNWIFPDRLSDFEIARHVEY